MRGRAVDALSTCGDETIPPRLLPLAKGELGLDPQDEMKGYALQIMWPKHMSADELFSMITRPNEGFVGAYVMFLTKTLPETLAADDLPVALKWAGSFAAKEHHTGDYHRRSLADSIFVRAWRNLDHPGVMDALVEYVFARLRPSHNLFGSTGLREAEQFYEHLETDVARRRRFLLAAARRVLAKIDAYHLMRARLLQQIDLTSSSSWSAPSGSSSKIFTESKIQCEHCGIDRQEVRRSGLSKKTAFPTMCDCVCVESSSKVVSSRTAKSRSRACQVHRLGGAPTSASMRCAVRTTARPTTRSQP